jgi:hypothetical protein
MGYCLPGDGVVRARHVEGQPAGGDVNHAIRGRLSKPPGNL